MDEREREALLEQAIGAHRGTDPGGAILPHPAWCDLPVADRLVAFDETVRARDLEAALDPEGLSTTARRILGRLR